MSASQIAVPEVATARSSTSLLPPTSKTPSFAIDAANKSYKHQYANIYFVRLRILRPCVQENAKRKWKEVAGNPDFVPRVLEVVKGKICYVIGTVYMEMPLKPNVLDDIARDHSIPAPINTQKYWSEDDSIMLEDESGRIRLVGERLRSARPVTGVIMGVLGMETGNDEFEVIDFCFAGMPPQAGTADGEELPKSAMTVDTDSDEWLAIVSGLDIGASDPPDAQLQLLSEYICGEACGPEDQAAVSRISRLIIAGDSLAPQVAAVEETEKKSRKYGQDTSSFSPHPLLTLSAHLTDIAHSIPIHLLTGPSDPSGTILPQQALPRAMFGGASGYSSFSTETNPTYLHIGCGDAPTPTTNGASTSKPKRSKAPTCTALVHSGQPLDDMAKYLPSLPTTRIAIAESTLLWRHIAPTAPDTLWCHPYFTADPFLLAETPDLYIVGNQPEFKTKLVVEKASAREPEKRCRIVLVPRFKSTGLLVMVNLRTLAVKTVSFAVHGMKAGGEMDVDPAE